MAENKDLYERSLSVLAQVLKHLNVEKSQIERMIENHQLQVDEPGKVRLHAGNLIFYAYDFRLKGEQARFDEVVEKTKRCKGMEHVAQYILGGSIARPEDPEKDIIGWYVTVV
jgi:hypothetical protein